MYENGSVITTDTCISIFAGIVKADKKYEPAVLPLFLKHLTECRPKETAQHAERASVCVDAANKHEFIAVLEKRLPLLSGPQQKRIQKLIKKIESIR